MLSSVTLYCQIIMAVMIWASQLSETRSVGALNSSCNISFPELRGATASILKNHPIGDQCWELWGFFLGGKPQKISSKFVWGLCDAQKNTFGKKNASNAHSSPQQWSEQSTSAYTQDRNPCSSPFDAIFQGDPCHLPLKTGHCRMNIPRWGFDSGACRKFTYGGCGGNQNRFATKLECIQYCTDRRNWKSWTERFFYPIFCMLERAFPKRFDSCVLISFDFFWAGSFGANGIKRN